jgi:DNA polymerase-1
MSQLALFTPTSEWVPPKALPELKGESLVAVDIETRDMGLEQGLGPGWPFSLGFVIGISVAWGEDKQVYLPVRHPDTKCFEPSQIKGWLTELFAQENTRFVFHNSGYDLPWLNWQFQCGWPKNIDDTAILSVLVDENRYSYRLDALCKDYGLPGKDEVLLREAIAAFGLKDAKGEMYRLPAKFTAPYAEQDARATLNLFKLLYPIAEQEQTLEAYKLECDLIPMIAEMRKRGIRVDMAKAEESVAYFEDERNKVLAEISRNLGKSTTMEAIRSPQWLIDAFTREGIPFPKTEKGNASFQADWMSKHEHWLPKLITAAKKYTDASEKFFKSYIIDFAKNGRIHPTINQYRSDEGGTRSHRFSYSNPPLQQAPSKQGLFASAFRGVFLPEEGEVWCATDYSQIEIKLMCHYAELIGANKADVAGDAYRSDPNTDFHSFTASISGLPRKDAKSITFGRAYGAGLKKFAQMTGMTEADAKAAMSQYDARMPFIAELSKSCQERAANTGHIRLINGALRHFDLWECAEWSVRGLPVSREEALRKTKTPGDDWYGRRIRRAMTSKAMNALVQGSSAIQMKSAMRDIWQEGIVPLLTLHDELDISVSSQQQVERIAELMRDTVKLTIPVTCDSECGLNWADSMRGRSFDEVMAEVQLADAARKSA